MNAILNEAEVRVLGALIEKQVTTPEYYPLTLNALVNACNQLSNREPVVHYDESTVSRALESLREKNLAYVFYGSESRVPKYKHVARENLHLDDKQLAALCVLMLRGYQTVGEIKGRTGRLYPFEDLNEVEAALDDLNLDRFLTLLRRHCARAQFIVITHQKRTMEAADWLYGVSMGGDGVSKVLSRRLPAENGRGSEVAEVA